MCRLFGMVTSGARVPASYWLLDASRSLRSLSHRMPHGVGLGWFSLGDEPVRDRAPLAAFTNPDFAVLGRHVVSDTFLSHVRDASVGGLTVRNCHPFTIDDRLFAHNGVVKGRDRIASWLTEADRSRVAGQTDSEMVFAYLSAEIRRCGDITAGLIEAVRRIGAELPVFSLNLLLAAPRRLWALRYPASNELWALAPGRGGTNGDSTPAHVVASEPMDDNPGWRPLQPGELLVVDGQAATSLFPFGDLAHPLRRADLSLREAASQEIGPVASVVIRATPGVAASAPRADHAGNR